MHARMPARAIESELSSVSCASPVACTAVGYFQSTGVDPPAHPWAERWNGSRWAIQRIQMPAGASSASLAGVSCASKRACIAVGSVAYNTAHPPPYYVQTAWIVRWNGHKWALASPAIPSGSTGSGLSGVSCVAATACTVVGGAAIAYPSPAPCYDTQRTLVERWNGAAWSLEPSPNQAQTNCDYVNDSGLAAVSCTSRRTCVSVGDSSLGGGQEGSSASQYTLAESWDGVSWSIRSTVNPDQTFQGNALVGVSCASYRACTSVGYTDNANGDYLSLIERWNGSRWSVERTPKGVPALSGVACTSTVFCMAVGGNVSERSSSTH
jgi:hypothetical protein